jgi:hypothetical protein
LEFSSSRYTLFLAGLEYPVAEITLLLPRLWLQTETDCTAGAIRLKKS